MRQSASTLRAAERAWAATGSPTDVPDPTHNPGVLLVPPTSRIVPAAELVRGDVLTDGSTVTMSAAVTDGQAVFEVDWSTVRHLDATTGVPVTRKEQR